MTREYPHEPEAERSLIGACLLSDSAIERAAEIVTADDFHKPSHQTIFHAILATWAEGRVDVVLVHQKLAGTGIELADLLAFTDPTPAISNAAKYATLIVQASLARRLIAAGAEISRLGWETSDPGQASEQARALVAGLDMPSGRGAPDMDVSTFIDTTDVTYDWLIPEFLERRDRMLVTSREGEGKSFLLAQLAVQCAAGIHPWTWQPVEPRNVLIVDLENSARMVTRRLSALRTVAGHRLDPQRLRIHCRPEGIDLTTRTDRLWLLDRCQANATELLIIGPVYRMSAGSAEKGDIGAEEHTRKITRALDEARNRCNVTLLMETHAPHGQAGVRDLRPFGSSVWLRWPEFGIGLRKDTQDPSKYAMEHWRGARDQRAWPVALQRGGKWPWNPIMATGTFHNNPRSAA